MIELLVVISIIVLLVSILVPAMEKAIYQAQLAVCSSRLDGIAYSAVEYTLDNRAMYPYRPGVEDNTWYKPNNLYWNGKDARPYLYDYLSIDKFLNDPLQPTELVYDERRIPAEERAGAVFINYHLFFGWGYLGETMLLNRQSFLTWNGQPYRVLAGDRMVRVGDGRGDHGSHAVPGQRWIGQQGVNGGWTDARFGGDYKQVGTDLNIAMTDGSVQRFNNVLPHGDGRPLDSRFQHAPEFSTGWEYDQGTRVRIYLAK